MILGLLSEHEYGKLKQVIVQAIQRLPIHRCILLHGHRKDHRDISVF
jgi:hypothetical protein